MKNLFNWIKNFILELKHNLKLLYIINIISVILASLQFLLLFVLYPNIGCFIFYIPTIFIFLISLFSVKTYKKFPKTTKWISVILGLFIIIFLQIIYFGMAWLFLYGIAESAT